MATTTMHFGPEWMRAKQPPSRTQLPPSPPPAVSAPPSSASTYSALVSPAPPPQPVKRDEAYPFRYSKEEMLTIYKDGGGRGGLGLEVERWKGIVREVGSEPIGLREMGDAEKKLFGSPLNSDLRRRQSTDYLSPLSTQATGVERPRLNNPASPMRDRFGSLMRRKSTDQPPLITPKKLSIPSGHGPLAPPRDGNLPSSRTRIGPFDGVLNGGDSWVARRRASEGLQKASGRGDFGDTEHQESKESEIKEEEEEGGQSAGLQTDMQETPNIARESSAEPDPLRPIATGGPSKESMPPETQVLNADIEHISLSDEAFPGTSPSTQDDVNSASGPPPGIPDLASIEWSYLDPQGQVQGPFRADLMQKWYDDGYFTPDLLMRRTHLDTEWTALGELARRSGGNKIFLSLPLGPPVPPPGLSRQTESPIQGFITPVDQIPFNGPYQPAPIRSLRASTLDSYLGTVSNPSDSPSSSFGGGRFGNSSPDPAAFGGRVGSNSYPVDPPVGGRTAFPVAPEPSSAFRRNAFNEPSLDTSVTFRPSPFGNVAPGRASTIDAYDSTYGSVQAPWPASPGNAVGPAFDGTNGGRSSADMGSYSSNLGPGSLDQTSGFGNVRVPQDTFLQDHGPANLSFPGSKNNVGNPQDMTGPETDGKISNNPGFNSYANGLGHTSFAQGQQYNHTPSVPYAAPQQHQPLPTLTSAFGHHDNGATQKTIPQPANQYPHYASHTTTAQSPWNSHETATGRRPGPFDALHPTSTNTIVHRPVTPLQPTAWGRTGQHSQPVPLASEPSPWFTGSQRIVEDNWKETPGPSNLTFSNVGQHNELQQVLGAPMDSPNIVPVISEQSQQQPPSEPVTATAVHVPTSTVTKSRRKSTAQTVQIPSTPTAPPTTSTSVVKSPSSPPPASAHPKPTAWSTEDEPNAKPSGVALSLRDIQEAEAKKTDARKAAERERERVARAAVLTPVVNEEPQAYTASWGLPTSQAGAARNNVQQKETPAAPTVTASTPPVWTNATKSQPTKKSMKEIQEEEERRKKTASKESAARRAYAENTNQATPSIPATGSAWTTVGPSGKNALGIITTLTRPSLTPSTSTAGMSGSPSTFRANGSTVPRSPAASAVKTSQRIDDYPATPSHDFLKWLSDSLKGLNSSVNVEEIMSMLLSFPMDPDSSTAEIISEMIYANSTMLDGRRFASEFVSKRKIDAASRPKVVGVAGSAAKPVSIADVVKAQPKPAQQEWGGFKVVNKKKKGGR